MISRRDARFLVLGMGARGKGQRLLANEEERKMGCAECCDCWCHGNFTDSDGSDRDERRGFTG